MAAPNSIPTPHEFSPLEEVAWDQGVLTPYIADNVHISTASYPQQRHAPKPRQTGHVREFTSDSEMDPNWTTAPEVPEAVSDKTRRALFDKFHQEAERRHIATLASDPELPMSQLAAIIRARAEKRSRRK